MKPESALMALVLCLASGAANAQPAEWQKQMDEARRSAARGVSTGLVVRPGSEMEANWPAGVYFFYNNPRPFCYAYMIPGEWYPSPSGTLRSKDGRSIADVTFRPPSELAGAAGATMLERARNVAVRQLERDFRQPMVDVELKPFESARSGTWLLKAAPVSARDGRLVPFPLYIIVDLSPHTVAEINVFGTVDDENLARRIIERLRTSSDPDCYAVDMERMYKALYGER